MIKADATFFKYYLPALEKALEEDHNNDGLMLKDPNWFYPDELYDTLDEYEDLIYDKYSLLDDVYAYFDARNHNFPNIQGVDIDEYRDDIINKADALKKKYNITRGALIN